MRSGPSSSTATARSWSSPAPARARPASSSSASAGCSRRKEDLLPEQLLVLTYNVKAARELRERIEERIGPALAARLSVSNFHSFCHRVLRESASEAGMPPNPDVLDGVGQLLLISDLRPSLELIYHARLVVRRTS